MFSVRPSDDRLPKLIFTALPVAVRTINVRGDNVPFSKYF